jgi:hydrophobic/amphiphilic exporter-1 (mainly G- bacteria), HAE1 family
MHLARWAMSRPVTTLMLAVSAVVLGMVAVMRLPLLLYPSYDSPYLTIVVPYRSSAPEEIERLIVRPLEDSLGTLSHLQRMTSQATATQGRVRLEFAYGTDMDLAAIEVRDRLDRVRRRLPQDVTDVLLRRWSSDDIPVMRLRIGWQGAPEQLYDMVVNTIERRLQAVDGVANVEVYGLQRKDLRIEIDPASLEMYGLTTLRLVDRLRRNHLNLGGGSIEDGGVRYLLRSLGDLQTPEQVADLPVGDRGLRLRDVARVQYAYPPKDHYDRLDQEDAMTMHVYRNSMANVVRVAQDVHRTLDAIRQLPQAASLGIFVYHDSSQEILTRLRHLQWSGLLGMGLALAVLWMFLRHLRVTAVLGMVIPISLLTTFLIMYLLREGLGSSVSLNVVSLSGLMLSVGMLVDSSVVVLENIFRLRQTGLSAREASLVGSQEMGQAVLAATATSIVVFLPTIFVAGNFMGRMMSEFALVVCAVLLASLGVALTLVPMLSARFLKSADIRAARPQTWLTVRYGTAIRCTLRYRWMVLGIAAGVFALSLHLYTSVITPNRDLSRMPRRWMSIYVEMPRALPFDEAQTLMTFLENAVLEQRDALEIRHVITSTRRDGEHRLEVYFRSVENSRTPTRILHQRFLESLPKIAGVSYRVRGDTSAQGQQNISVQLQGPHSEVLADLSEQIKTRLSRIPGVFNVSTDVDRGDEELQLTVDRGLAQRRELPTQRVASTVALAVSDRPIATMTWEGQEVEVYLNAGTDGFLSADQLRHMPVSADEERKAVSVGHVVRSRVQRAPTSMSRENRLQTTEVVVRTQDGITMSESARSIRQALASLILPTGYDWQLGRSYRSFVQAQKESTFTLSLAIVLVYIIMAALFESLVLPFAIMLTVPFALSGVVGIFVLTGSRFNQMADLGMLILCGLVVNSGIMLVAATNQLRAKGLSRTEALIQSGQQRLRPIVMTVITTLMGLAPMVAPILVPAFFGPTEYYVAIYGPIGLVVAGGLCTSTVLTLLLLPAMYALLDDGIIACRRLRALLSAA